MWVCLVKRQLSLSACAACVRATLAIDSEQPGPLQPVGRESSSSHASLVTSIGDARYNTINKLIFELTEV